ncbi:biotin--[acetyl-CoA-carboxylase] ligase [Acinetobacter sp. ANC 4558]|uniref:biotin--[acetyl-CoA-carboxylase] ligase n=1 Tax=Acinetobacter sp. ANC 4558 TaxID=1977876 RepID=UPI000A32FFD1|nr:biotin--[acetyl-CoA-carboxylase] ligase [Acinetobacter sp. ANC 4558]OTG85904.1 biotin--[acetyl-CoA-carboxylase] ligase [Acinetobacter sp. ANC 4558]
MDLETRQLQKYLADANQLPDVLILKPVTTSTNDDVQELALKGVQSILICSEKQTKGRGQKQKPWISPPGNIYLSTLLNVQTPLDGRLSLEIALNILQIPSFKNINLQIKWPNDLYIDNKKLGGILIEPITLNQVIVGLGINLHPVPTQSLDQETCSLSELGLSQIDRTKLIAELYLAIQQAGRWFDYNCYNLAARFNHHAAFKHEPVSFEHTQGHIYGEFLGIQDDGAVLIQQNEQILAFYQGRLRRYSVHQE